MIKLKGDERIGLVMMSAVGDAVHALPVVNAIKRHAPASHLTWVLQRDDGRWFFLTAGLNNLEKPIDESAGIGVAAAARKLLAATP
jgi:heptosyltransferase I